MSDTKNLGPGASRSWEGVWNPNYVPKSSETFRRAEGRLRKGGYKVSSSEAGNFAEAGSWRSSIGAEHANPTNDLRITEKGQKRPLVHNSVCGGFVCNFWLSVRNSV